MRRALIGAAISALFVAMVGNASGAGAANGQITLRSSTAKLTGTVNVVSLPKASGHQAGTGPMRHIPLRASPGGAGGGGSASVVAAAGKVSPLLSFSKGTVLSGALKDSDNTVGLTPPDMAVGADATHVLQMVNVVGKIWTNGVPGTPFQLNAFFLAGANFTSDPWVLFDQESGRWFAGIFDITLGGERIAVSQTGNPTGSWFVYAIQYPGQPGGGCPDQGKGGIDSDTVALGFNEFSGVGCTGGFLGAGIELFSKAQMLAGQALSFQFTNPMPQFFSLVPAQALTNGMTTLFFASNGGAGSTKLHRMTSTGIPPSATLATLPDLTVKRYNTPPPASQPRTAKKLDSGDVRMQHVVQKVIGPNIRLLMSWTNKCTPTGDTTSRDCPRVTVTNETAGSLVFSKNIATLGAYNFYPAATWNSSNDIVVTFGQSNGSTNPRLVGTASNGSSSFGPPIVLAAGSKPNTTGRYGDYFAVAQDPANQSNVWAAGEIGGPVNNDWQTAVVEVNVVP
jgi:hypothetical protein